MEFELKEIDTGNEYAFDDTAIIAIGDNLKWAVIHTSENMNPSIQEELMIMSSEPIDFNLPNGLYMCNLYFPEHVCSHPECCHDDQEIEFSDFKVIPYELFSDLVILLSENYVMLRRFLESRPDSSNIFEKIQLTSEATYLNQKTYDMLKSIDDRCQVINDEVETK